MGERFLRLPEVAEILDVTESQVYAMVRSGELRSLKIGAKGHWRVEREALEDYIAEAYRQTADFVKANPLVARDEVAAD